MRSLFILIMFLACMAGFSQKSKPEPVRPGIYDRLDTRVDNMRYWKKMAEKGLTPYNPDVPIPPAIFRGSQIKASGIRTLNSPDVAVTTLTNVTESENSVFVDPNNPSYVLNSNNSTSWTGSSVGTLYGANYFQTNNAGIGWAGSPNGAGGANSGDPTTAIGLNGREYVNFISSSDGQGIAFSDNGSSWTTATVAPSPGDLADKNHMWIDNSPGSPYEGNLYVAWTDFGGADDAEIKISRSVNDGVTWSSSLNISSAINAGSHNQGVNIQTGPGGEVYACWAVYDSWPSDETAIGFARSTNGGASYQPAARIISNIRGIRTTTVSKNHRVNSFPVMAVDISGGLYNGNIYVVWTNIGIPGVNTGTNASVYMIRSSDGGTTWSTPVRVNQGPNIAGKKSYFPWISCDPVTGVLSVVFYDDRNVSTTQNEVYVAYSTDAGNTWTDFQVSDVAFTPSAIPGLASSYMGDYLGITSKNGRVYPCWTDNRNGLFMTWVSPFEIGLNADFTTSTTTLCTGGSVTFSDISTGPPVTWNWSFPGGTPSSYTGQTPPAITYAIPGTYDVRLIVSDGTTSDTMVKPGFIRVRNVIASFTGAPTTVVIGNSVSFTDQSQCSPESWEWTFPGGVPSAFSGQNPPAIQYSTVGVYDVTLRVTKQGSADTLARTGYIHVIPPIFIITNGTITTCQGDFYDSGGPTGSYANNESFTETFYPSTAGNKLRFTFSSFSTEAGYDYLSIYDGTSTSAPLIGTYDGTSGPGVVTATNAAGALTFRFTSDVGVVSTGWTAAISCIYVPPVAVFTAVNTTTCPGLGVTFHQASTGSPTSWVWSFPGGTPSNFSGQNPPPVFYSATGSYNVSLTVADGFTSHTLTRNAYITCEPVLAGFSATPTTVVVGNTVTFTDTSSCNPGTWNWSFPGGTPSVYSGQTPPPVTYNTIGTYDVSLTVSSAAGSNTRNKQAYISVISPTFNMTNGTVTTCTGNFYDSGGPNGDYQNYESITETFYPSTPGNKIRFVFTSFETESGYDFLKIYDGVNASAPLIGTYSGTTSPGTVTATNTAGTITFVFTSDISVVKAGWKATISCYDPTAPAVADFIASPLTAAEGQTVSFTDQSLNNPTSWTWSITPSTYIFTGGTSGSSQHPQVQFTAQGDYSVTLTAANAFGSGAKTRNAYIHVINCGISTFPWSEGFENGGIIPTCWTQEQVNNSGLAWTFITGNGGGYPATAHSGTLNACLKDNSSADHKTKLITPKLNLSGLSNPVLKFWHTQTYWSPDQDYLLVYYKTSIAGAWIQLASYTSSITEWTQETLTLPAASAEYFIAFEGNARYGRGVCIDDAEVFDNCITYLPVSVGIEASQNPVCSETEMSFTANPLNGGSAPVYKWMLNGQEVPGVTGSVFNHFPADNDSVVCILTSNASCVSGNPATSNAVVMTVYPSLTAGVTITASENPVGFGTLVTFTATPIAPGSSPVFQWKVNGLSAGTNSNIFAYTPSDGDQVMCIMNSNAPCINGNPANSNIIEMIVNMVPVNRELGNITVNGTACYDAQQTIIVAGSNTAFTVANGGHATLIAGKNILMYPGTTVAEGGYLLGKIAPGGPWCPPPAKLATLSADPVPLRSVRKFFHIFPNPARDEFTVALKGPMTGEQVTAEIYDMKGEKIITGTFENEMKHTFRIADHPAGLYLVRVTAGSMTGTERIVVLK